MKMVIAFIQTHMAAKVVEALHGVPGVSGATFAEVRGFGRGHSRRARDGDEEDLLGTVPKVRVEVVARDEAAPRVVEAIRAAAHTGNRGDGKVVVVPVDSALRVSTGETGDAAC